MCAPRTTFVLKSCDCRSCGGVLRVLLLHLKVANFQPVRECTPRTTFVLKSCDFVAGAAGMYSAYYLCAEKSRFCRRSCGSVPRILLLYLKVAIFQPELRECAPRTTFALKRCAVQVLGASALCKLRCASCSAQVALRRAVQLEPAAF